MITKEQQFKIKEITEKFKPKMIGIFGSYARGENIKESDLDLLIEFENKINLLDLIGLEQELSEQLSVKVDLITNQSVNDQLRPYIEKDLIILSEKGGN